MRRDFITTISDGLTFHAVGHTSSVSLALIEVADAFPYFF